MLFKRIKGVEGKVVEKFVLALIIDGKEKRSCSFTGTELKLLMYGLGYAKLKDYYGPRKLLYDKIYKKISGVKN